MMRPAVLVALWIALAHPSPSPLEHARFTAIAAGIARAAHETPLPIGEERTALLLGAIAEHEGHLREDVRRCETTGDQGLAVTLFQLHPGALGYTPRDVACSDDAVAARLALATLRAGLRFCKGDMRCAIRLYASGKNKRTRAAEEIEALWRSRLRPTTIKLSPQKRRR